MQFALDKNFPQPVFVLEKFRLQKEIKTMIVIGKGWKALIPRKGLKVLYLGKDRDWPWRWLSRPTGLPWVKPSPHSRHKEGLRNGLLRFMQLTLLQQLLILPKTSVSDISWFCVVSELGDVILPGFGSALPLHPAVFPKCPTWNKSDWRRKTLRRKCYPMHCSRLWRLIRRR